MVDILSKEVLTVTDGGGGSGGGGFGLVVRTQVESKIKVLCGLVQKMNMKRILVSE